MLKGKFVNLRVQNAMEFKNRALDYVAKSLIGIKYTYNTDIIYSFKNSITKPFFSALRNTELCIIY